MEQSKRWAENAVLDLQVRAELRLWMYGVAVHSRDLVMAFLVW